MLMLMLLLLPLLFLIGCSIDKPISHVSLQPHLDMRSAGADSCQPLALAKVAVNAQFQRALDHLTLVVLNLVMSLVHVHCQVLEVTGQSACW